MQQRLPHIRHIWNFSKETLRNVQCISVCWNRFKSNNSNESVYLGRITKHESHELRIAFVQISLGENRLSKRESN
jgi:hypothetical protein